MKESNLTINPLTACELLIQEMGSPPPQDLTLPLCMQAVNDLRIENHWPLASSMSCFNPSLTPASQGPLFLDMIPLRAFWEKGLTLLLKHNRQEGVAQMLACCKPLAEYPGDHILTQLGRVFYELLPLMGLNEAEVMIELAGRFDHLLRDKDHIIAVPAENLLRDCLFYLSLKKPLDFMSAWIWTPQAANQLHNRLRWHAKQFSTLLFPEPDTDLIDKTLIQKNLLPLTDALLFIGQIQLRTRFILRLEKIQTRMLKIAVPVQLLMAEALRLS